tara:strand:- start:707 stop:1921 length:1215 start_codon:yes stop_codon:yes gene_type:complete
MAEREGIANLDYLEDTQSLAQADRVMSDFQETEREASARRARERFDKQEFELEMTSDLPPEFQPGGIYSLLSSLGKSFPDLKYHTFGQVPGRFREAFEELEGARQKIERSPMGRARIEATYPTVSGRSGALLGSFVPDLSEAKQRAKEVIGDNFLQSARRGTTLEYGPPHSKVAMPSLIGEEFYEATSPAKKFNVVDMKEGEVGPGFLTGPTSSSILLSRLPESMSGYDAGRQGGTLFHELFHAGAQHPRIDDFLISPYFNNLDSDVKYDIINLLVNNHKYLYPLDDYEKRYRELSKKGEDGQSGIDLIMSQADDLRKKLSEQGDEKQLALLDLAVRTKELGGDPLDVIVKNKMDPEDVEKLETIALTSFHLREFLNATSDLQTGQRRGNLYYPPQARPKPTKP